MRGIPTATALDALNRAATLVYRARRYWNDGSRDETDVTDSRILLMRAVEVSYELSRLMSEICDEGI